MSTERLAEVFARLRGPLWRSPLADQLAVIADGEAIAEKLRGEARWAELARLAGLLSEAYCRARTPDDDAQRRRLDERRKHWCGVDVEAAQRAETDAPGALTLAALQRLGRARIDVGADDNAAAHDTFMQAVCVAERLHGERSPELVEVLLLATTGASPSTWVELAGRAVAIAEATEGKSSERLAGPLKVLAEGLAEAERIDEAIVVGERALTLASAEARAYFMLPMLLAWLYSAGGRFDDSIAMRRLHLARAETESERCLARRGLAGTLAEAGRHGESLVVLDEALAADPSNPWLACARALALHALGRDAEARTEAQRALAIAGNRGETFAAKVAAKLGDLATALSDR